MLSVDANATTYPSPQSQATQLEQPQSRGRPSWLSRRLDATHSQLGFGSRGAGVMHMSCAPYPSHCLLGGSSPHDPSDGSAAGLAVQAQ